MKKGAHTRITLALALAVGAWGCEEKKEAADPAAEQPEGGQTAGAAEAAAPEEEGETYTPELKGERARGWDASVAVGAASGLAKPAAAREPTGADLQLMRWVKQGEASRLELSFHDGVAADINPAAAAQVPLKALGEAKGWPLTRSPDGALSVLVGSDGSARLVRTGGEDVIVFPASAAIQGAAFSPDGGALFLSDPQGKLRVWKDVAGLTAEVEGEVKLQDYVARLNGDFRAVFGPMRGGIWSGEGPSVVYSEPDGQLIHWDVRKPSEASYVVKVDGPPRSAALAGDTLLVTSSTGQLRASSISRSDMLRWSVKATGDLVAAGSDPEVFAALEGGTLRLASMKTGEALWTKELGEGEPCGLALDTGSGRVAACVGGQVTIASTTNGDALAHAKRDGERVSVALP